MIASPAMRGGLALCAALAAATVLPAGSGGSWLPGAPALGSAGAHTAVAHAMGALAGLCLPPALAAWAMVVATGWAERRLLARRPYLDPPRPGRSPVAVGAATALLTLAVPAFLVGELLVAVYTRPGAAADGLVGWTRALAWGAGLSLLGVGTVESRLRYARWLESGTRSPRRALTRGGAGQRGGR